MEIRQGIEKLREGVSEVRSGIDDALDGSPKEVEEEKENLEQKIEELPVSGREWSSFSGLLNQEKPSLAEEKAESFGWSHETLEEVARIYVNVSYLQAELTLAKGQRGVYEAGKDMRAAEQGLDESDARKVADNLNRSAKKLKEAYKRVTEAEKDFDRSRTASGYFQVSTQISEKAEARESDLERARKELRAVRDHNAEMRERVT